MACEKAEDTLHCSLFLKNPATNIKKMASTAVTLSICLCHKDKLTYFTENWNQCKLLSYIWCWRRSWTLVRNVNKLNTNQLIGISNCSWVAIEILIAQFCTMWDRISLRDTADLSNSGLPVRISMLREEAWLNTVIHINYAWWQNCGRCRDFKYSSLPY